MTQNLKSDEIAKRNKLKDEKPYVYQKTTKFSEKVKKGESIAIIRLVYDYACNFSCQHCCETKVDKNKKRYFTIEDVKELSRQADEMGLAHFVITGGEPMVFPDFDEIVKAIDPTKFYITSDTNGWLLDEKRARHLKEIGLDKIQLSLDSLNESEHEEFRRVKGAYQHALRAIDAAQKADLSIIVQTVATKQRVRSEEFVKFLRFLNGKNVPVFVTLAKPVGAWEGNYDALAEQKDLDYLHSLGKKYNVFTHLTPAYGLDLGCIAVKRMISITKYGDVMPCPYLYVSIGNFFKEPLKKIVERGLNIRWFGKYMNTCLVAVNRHFIKNYVAKTYGKPLPIPYSEMFKKQDFINPEKEDLFKKQ
jgi:MoaA/NifB/PqqE/SkfB family radical SAM enzyme